MEAFSDPNVEALHVYRVLSGDHYQRATGLRTQLADTPELTYVNADEVIELRRQYLQSLKDTHAFVRAAISCARETTDALEE